MSDFLSRYENDGEEINKAIEEAQDINDPVLTIDDAAPLPKGEFLNEIRSQTRTRKEYPRLYPYSISISTFSYEEAMKTKVVHITNDNNSGAGSINDPAMGRKNISVRCDTCRALDCGGHYGIIELPKHFWKPHPKAINLIIYVLTVICTSCSALLPGRAELEEKGYLGLPLNTRLKALYNNYAKSDTPCSSNSERNKKIKRDADKLNKKLQKAGIKTEIKNKDNKVCWVNPTFLLTKSKEKFAFIYTQQGGEEKEMPIDQVYNILNNISREDASLMGFGVNSHPVNLIMRHVLVTPPEHRRSYFADGQEVDNPVTRLYLAIVKEVVKINHGISTRTSEIRKAFPNNRDIQNEETFLENYRNDQYKELTAANKALNGAIETFFDKKKDQGSRQPPTKTLPQSLGGKHGDLRKGILSSTAVLSTRTVISPTTYHTYQTVVLPDASFRTQTQRETINYTNIEHFKELLKTGKITHVQRGNGRIAVRNANFVLKIGDKIDRLIIPGDRVVANRNPSIHRFSMMSHVIARDTSTRLDPNKRGTTTARIHITVTGPYNADYDGDEMTFHFSESLPARAEQQYLNPVEGCQLHSRKPGMVYGLKMNSVTAVFLLTNSETILEPHIFNDLLEYIRGYTGNSFNYESYQNRIKRYGLNPNSGQALFSALLPDDFRYFKEETDNIIMIFDGVLISGRITGADISDSSNAIPHRIIFQYGYKRSVEFINVSGWLLNHYISEVEGFSVSLADMIGDDENLRDLNNREVMMQISVEFPESPDPEYNKAKEDFINNIVGALEQGDLTFLTENTQGNSTVDYFGFASWIKNEFRTLSKYDYDESMFKLPSNAVELSVPVLILNEQDQVVDIGPIQLDLRYNEYYKRHPDLQAELMTRLDEMSKAVNGGIIYDLRQLLDNQETDETKYTDLLIELGEIDEDEELTKKETLIMVQKTLKKYENKKLLKVQNDYKNTLNTDLSKLRKLSTLVLNNYGVPFLYRTVYEFLTTDVKGKELMSKIIAKIPSLYGKSQYSVILEKIGDLVRKIGFDVNRPKNLKEETFERKNYELKNLIEKLSSYSNSVFENKKDKDEAIQKILDQVWTSEKELEGKAQTKRSILQNKIYDRIVNRVEVLGEPTGNPVDDEFLERRIIQTIRDSSQLSNEEFEDLLGIKRNEGKLVESSLYKNSMLVMSKRGAKTKGDDFNLQSISVSPFQQYFGDKRPKSTMNKGRYLATTYSKGPEARGLCKSDFIGGLNVSETIQHYQVSLKGTADTSLSTSKIGEMERSMMRSTENQIIYQDGTVRSTGGIISQFIYGGNGFDTQFMVMSKTPDGRNIMAPFDPKTIAEDLNAAAGWIKVKIESDVEIYNPNSEANQEQRYKFIKIGLEKRLNGHKRHLRKLKNKSISEDRAKVISGYINFINTKLKKLETYDDKIPKEREENWFHEPNIKRAVIDDSTEWSKLNLGSPYMNNYEIARLIGDRALVLSKGKDTPKVDVIDYDVDDDILDRRDKNNRKLIDLNEELKLNKQLLYQEDKPEERARIENDITNIKKHITLIMNRSVKINERYQESLNKITLRLDPLIIARRELIDGVLPLQMRRQNYKGKEFTLDPNNMLLPPSFWATDTPDRY